MSNFVNAAKAMSNQTRTENGGIAYSTTKGGALLDLYAKIGGMRKRDASAIISDWKAARAENPTLADNLGPRSLPIAVAPMRTMSGL